MVGNAKLRVAVDERKHRALSQQNGTDNAARPDSRAQHEADLHRHSDFRTCRYEPDSGPPHPVREERKAAAAKRHRKPCKRLSTPGVQGENPRRETKGRRSEEIRAENTQHPSRQRDRASLLEFRPSGPRYFSRARRLRVLQRERR